MLQELDRSVFCLPIFIIRLYL